MTIEKYIEGIKSGAISIHESVSNYIKNIEEKDSEIGAFLDVYKDEALEQAREMDEKTSEGALYGVPVAIKDNILIKNKKTTSASKILENYYASYDATVIKKLREAGAIILGKTNLDEFAMGSSTENSSFKLTRNPLDLERVPGGSAGGSVASVAGEMAMASLGSDTGGSIRQPASFCGVVGLKPTYGTVSRYGLTALSSSLDQIGPITNSVKDSARMFSVLNGYDSYDATSSDKIYMESDNLSEKETKKIKIGIPKEYFIDGMDDEVKKAVNNVIDKFQKDGFEIKEVSLPHTEYAVSVYYIIMPAESSSNLARFDGIRYSRIKEADAKNLSDLYLKQRGVGIGEEPRRRILLGTFVLSSGYYDAYYAKAQKVRKLMLEDFLKVYEDVDVLITPVTPTTAFKIGEKKDDPLSMYLSDIFTIPANLAGIPAISIPTGERDGDALPINFQIMGKHFDERTLFSIGEYFEENLKQ